MQEVDDTPLILCVDDNEELTATLSGLLEKLPARVDVAADGRTALRFLLSDLRKDDPYALVVLDMWVPPVAGNEVDKGFGLRVLKRLQEFYRLLRPETPIIVFTAYPSYDDCVACIQAGAHDYLPKADPDSANNNMRTLFERCKSILYPDRQVEDPINRYLDRHLDTLIAEHAGGFVALIEEGVARNASIDAEVEDGFAILTGRSYDEVHDHFLRNPGLHWEEPLILNIPRGARS